MDNIRNLRKNIYSLEGQRKKIVDYLLNPRDMIEGSIYTVYKKCGNKNCRCSGRQVALMLARHSHSVHVFDLPDIDYSFVEQLWKRVD